MRAFWDMHTDATCSFDNAELSELYGCLANSGSSDEYNYYSEHNGANH